jgi:dipeptidyl aminopeptidase/acylaminoacyl peptidase
MKIWIAATLLMLALLGAACNLVDAGQTTPTAKPTRDPRSTLAPVAILASPTPDPYAVLSIEGLASRPYGGGEVQVHETLETTADFTRQLISYPSDGLTIYGFMNVPHGQGPFPVVIAVHGYVTPSRYNTLDYTTRYADALARAGYLVLHPNLRGYRPSDDGPNPFRIGSAIDVLNLIALVRQRGGDAGALQQADPDAIGLWGHSMGGGIAIRAVTVNLDVDAVVLYGAMSASEQANYERIQMWSGGTSGRAELDTPEEALQRISPIYHLDRMQAAVSIHHGAADDTVPPAWSQDLCTRLQALGKAVDCYSYEGQPHTFQGASDRLFIERTVAFFDAQLRG